jgi:rhodanese-related sulfurtransferase
VDLAANPGQYPQFAQQGEASNVRPEFIRVEQLVEDIINKKKPYLVDVRTEEEYKQAHIKGSVSIPLGEIHLRLAEIPSDRLVVLY